MAKRKRKATMPVLRPEVRARWKAAYKPVTVEYGNPEFRFMAKIGKSSRTAKTLYVPAELEIALTFDDGPAPQGSPKTEKVLKILKKYKAKAAFFVEHSRILDGYGKGILQRMVKEGHEVGIHGVDPAKHHLPHQDTPDFESKLKTMRNLIKEVIGSYPSYIRPPYGWGGWEKGALWSKSQLRKIYQKFDMIRVDGWEAEIGRSDFWKNVNRKIKAASEGNKQKLIILSHDLRDYDGNNLSEIIQEIKNKAGKVKVKIKYLTIGELLK